MKYEEISSLFNSFNDQKILIIGDVMVDTYLVGNVNRISPEAPVPVVAVTMRENRLGGAANVALNIKSLGGDAVICSVVGDDERGKLFLSLMEERNLAIDGIVLSEQRKTTVKTRVISQQQHLLRVDDETLSSLNEQDEQQLLDRTEQILDGQTISALVFQDYDKGVITASVISKIISLARKKQIPVLVDPKRNNFHHYKEVTWFKPNFKELSEGLKQDFKKSDYKAISEAAKEFQETHAIEFLMVTLSEYGVLLNTKHAFHHIPAEVRDISDVSGAGDTVIAVAALCAGTGISALHTAMIANIAGGLVCEKVGVVPVNKEDLLYECHEILTKE